MPTPELPQWKCHKIVRAARILDMVMHGNSVPLPGGATLHLDGGAKVATDAAWVQRCDPAVGGYYVVYEDGYTSFSPSKAFEDGYTRL